MNNALVYGMGTVLFPLLGAVAVRFPKSVSARRITAIVVNVLGALSALGVLLLGHSQSVSFQVVEIELFRLDPWSSILPALTCAVALANALTLPAWRTTPSQIGRRLLIVATTNGLFLSAHPLLLPLWWAIAALAFAGEFDDDARNDGTRTIFSIAMFITLALALAGALLFAKWHLGAVLLLAAAGWLRAAAFPFQSWLVAVTDRVPIGLVTLYFAPQTGVYVVARWVLPTIPEQLRPILVAIGGVSAVLGALMALAVRAPRRRLAYLWISQTAQVALGFIAASPEATAGGLICWVALGLSTSGFGLNIAMLEARRGKERILIEAGGLDKTPVLGFSTLALGLCSVGLPFTAGFIAEDLLMQGLMLESPYYGLLLIVTTAINGVTVLMMCFAFFGGTSARRGEVEQPDLVAREQWSVGGLLALLFLLGLAPAFGLHLLLNG